GGLDAVTAAKISAMEPVTIARLALSNRFGTCSLESLPAASYRYRISYPDPAQPTARVFDYVGHSQPNSIEYTPPAAGPGPGGPAGGGGGGAANCHLTQTCNVSTNKLNEVYVWFKNQLLIPEAAAAPAPTPAGVLPEP